MLDKILSDIFPAYGFCKFSDVSDNLISCRALEKIPENADSLITAIFPYNLGNSAYSESDISKYAVVPDYHNVIGILLRYACEKLKSVFPNEEFISFTDNSPIPEVKAALLSGLGVQGENGMLINKDYGSWVFIGEIITTMKLKPAKIDAVNSYCIGCGLCREACPTCAITERGIDKSRCLSDITQRKGELTDEMQQLIHNSGCAWGCDVCQNVCPMNADAKSNPLKEFLLGAELKARLTGDISDRAYAWRGRKVISRNLEILENPTERT